MKSSVENYLAFSTVVIQIIVGEISTDRTKEIHFSSSVLVVTEDFLVTEAFHNLLVKIISSMIIVSKS